MYNEIRKETGPKPYWPCFAGTIALILIFMTAILFAVFWPWDKEVANNQTNYTISVSYNATSNVTMLLVIFLLEYYFFVYYRRVIFKVMR